MLIEKIPVTWGKAEHVPFSIDGTTLSAGKGENMVTLDLEEAQSDTAVSIDIMQNYDGKLSIGTDTGVLPVATIAIPPVREELVETGETNDKGEPTYKLEKVPVDVENIQFTLYPMQYALEETKGEN